MTEIRPWLFIGSIESAFAVVKGQEARITHLLNVANDMNYMTLPHHVLLRLPLDDCVPVPAWATRMALCYAEDVRRDGGKMLVHCHIGKSRSVGIVAAILAVAERRPFTDALAEICRLRPQAEPHPAITQSLSEQIAFTLTE